jgi:hypothetical protein
MFKMSPGRKTVFEIVCHLAWNFRNKFQNNLKRKGVFMSDFNEDLEAIRVHQIPSGCLQNVFPIKSSKSSSGLSV